MYVIYIYFITFAINLSQVWEKYEKDESILMNVVVCLIAIDDCVRRLSSGTGINLNF